MTYAEQLQIYTGFIKPIDQQRMVVARRDFAERLKDSVNVPVVESQDQDMKTRELEAPPELPEEIEGKEVYLRVGAQPLPLQEEEGEQAVVRQ